MGENQPGDPRIHRAALDIARRCRWVIQACLREEEWADAEREFYLTACAVLESFTKGGHTDGR